jgi:uncharacterized membrane protein YfcA
MIGPWDWLMVMAGAFVGATLAATTGFGGAAVLLPLLVATFGPRHAIPILTVAQLIGNASRVLLNRRAVEWRLVGWFAIGAVPAAVAGGLLLARAPLPLLSRGLGVFLIALVVYRHARGPSAYRPRAPHFAVIGAALSFLSALVGSVGPLLAPFFLAYGLVKDAYIGTEAMATVVMHVTKLSVYAPARVLTADAAVIGLALGPVMVGGSALGKLLVGRMPKQVFVVIVEVTLVVAGLLLAAGKL